MSENLDFNKTRYTHRDYESLKKDLIDIIPSLTQKWTSTEESDPGIVLIKLISMLGDNLSYNMDKMALEMYLDSVTQRKNCAKILSLLGYKMHWYRSARVMATVRNMISSSSTASGNVNGSPIVIQPWSTTFRAGSLQYIMVNEEQANDSYITLLPLAESKTITLVEGSVSTARFSGKSLNRNRYYFTRSNIDEAHMRLFVDNGSGSTTEVGELVDNLYLVTNNDRVYFEFGVDEYDNPYIELIDFWKSLVGDNANFIVQYIVTEGSRGNVTDNAFEIQQYANGSCLYITNLANNTENSLVPYNAPGKDPQTPATARKESADYVFTHDTLVSASDFEKATRRFAGVSNSKLVDGEIIKLDSLDMHEIFNRKDDDTELSDYIIEEQVGGVDTYRVTPYIVLMYLIHQNFTYNSYEIDYNDSSDAYDEYVFDADSGTGGYTGQKFFPYKPSNAEVLQKVTEGIESNVIMNVEVHYATTKVFPFKVDGTLHFIEPLDPSTIVYIVDDIIPDALELYFSPENRSYGQKPTFLEIVDVIQSADNRIKYFDAETSLIDWVLTGAVAPKLDTTSFAKFQGLADTFNVDERFMKFEMLNITTEDLDLSQIIYGEDGYTVLPGYEPIDAVIPAQSSLMIKCDDIAQVRTLDYYVGKGILIYDGDK